jgi:hypothetical protein
MKVGSLVRNKSSQCVGIIVKIYKGHEDVLIHWMEGGKIGIWSRYSHNLEVICK